LAGCALEPTGPWATLTRSTLEPAGAGTTLTRSAELACRKTERVEVRSSATGCATGTAPLGRLAERADRRRRGERDEAESSKAAGATLTRTSTARAAGTTRGAGATLTAGAALAGRAAGATLASSRWCLERNEATVLELL